MTPFPPYLPYSDSRAFISPRQVGHQNWGPGNSGPAINAAPPDNAGAGFGTDRTIVAGIGDWELRYMAAHQEQHRTDAAKDRRGAADANGANAKKTVIAQAPNTYLDGRN